MSNKKYIFYIIMLFGILIFFVSGLLTRGQSYYNLFVADKTNYFMDLYNGLYSLYDERPYTHDIIIYPPLPLLIFKVMLSLIPHDIAGQSAFAIRASQIGQIILLIYMLITLLLFFALLIEMKKGSRIEKYIFTFVILLSAPFLFQFERANIIFVALLFSMTFVFFKNSNNRIVRELALVSLSISAAIKLYPALFSLLLIKERRFKEFFKVLIYGLALFILPFFAVGGISQITLLYERIFSRSNYVLSLGLGYAVNIQNLIRIIFGFFGDFGNTPILVARISSFVILFLGIFSAFFLRSKWKTVALLSLLMIIVPPISYEYTLIFMLIPLIMYLDREKKEKRIDYIYLACFILIFIPFTFGEIDKINKGFGHPAFPLTYGILIQNISLSIMTICLITQGLNTGIPKLIKLYKRRFIRFHKKF